MARILFIDDNPDQFRMILDTLEFIIDDLDIEYSNSVSDAIKKMCEKEYDVVIMDIFLPLGTNSQSIVGPKNKLYKDLDASHLGGLEVLDFLEKMQDHPKVLMHTASLDSMLIEMFSDISEYRIPKPCPPEVFISKVSEALCK
jgi:CheY-like chemotaxis protein